MRYLFEDFTLDLDRRELVRGDAAIAITPLAFDLLTYLVQNRSHVVSKDLLLDAVWDGRIVSEATLSSHINAVRRAVGDSGGEQRLVRTVARKGFRFVGSVMEEEADRQAATPALHAAKVEPLPLPLPDKPSIAVLPFLNLSGDPQQDYFADGIVEDIIGALARMRWLFVTARNSSFAYKDRTADVKQVGRELGVRYVLEGSLRKSADRIRITGQLIDAHSGAHIWAERFEGVLGDIFELQDQVTTGVVGAITPRLERAEIERALHKPTESLDAYDYYLRGMADIHQGTRDGVTRAQPLFRKAIDADPNFASAHAMAAWCHFWRKFNGWMEDRPHEIEEGVELARRAIELGPDDAVALARGGHALAHFLGDIDGGIELVDRALVLNPNFAVGWFLSGFLRIWKDAPDDAIERFQCAMRLSPLDSEMFRMQAGTAMAHLLANRPDDAILWAERASAALPSFLIAASIIAAGHALAGRMPQARQEMDRLRKLDPTLRISNLTGWIPLHHPPSFTLFADGLRRAGLPE
ncbi:MAG: winged helix-turn-helix domain-containing tetratricopeptide repeat protein [Kiloniellaceae bacterium]